jgi:hypothetical protein
LNEFIGQEFKCADLLLSWESYFAVLLCFILPSPGYKQLSNECFKKQWLRLWALLSFLFSIRN